MNKQPEALRWAAILEHQAKHDGATDYKHKAAAELRRLHAENERLREVLKKLEYFSDGTIRQYPDEHEVEVALRQEQPR